MQSDSANSLQSILKRRQRDEFVGREDYLKTFHQNIELPIDNEYRRFVYSIFGQGGVGKTTLLLRLQQIVESIGAVTGKTDETQRDIPMVMAQLSEQIEQRGGELKQFNARYKVYREKRHELEADPDAPQGFPSLIGRMIGKGGLRLARRIPIGGAAFELVEEEAVSTLVGDVATYVAKRLTNKDEVQLILEPVDVLTPLFLKDLQKVSEKHLVALFFDTFERTSTFIDGWLRNILEGEYGPAPANILFIIAGQNELDRNNWAPYEGLIARFSLDVFEEKEALDYLTRKGIEDEKIVRVILDLSGRLPLLIATLAREIPKTTNQVTDPSETAVQRFLKWVEDSTKRNLALNAALPRKLNEDIISIIIDDGEPRDLFSWLKSMPFVKANADGWAYHNTVRELMCRHKRHESSQGWTKLHTQLAEYYEGIQVAQFARAENSLRDINWQRVELEKLYHLLCTGINAHLPLALMDLLSP
jgi:hypothetical protein